MCSYLENFFMTTIKTYLKEWHDVFSLLDHQDRDDECEWVFHPTTTSKTKVKKANIPQGCQITRLRIVLRKTKFLWYLGIHLINFIIKFIINFLAYLMGTVFHNMHFFQWSTTLLEPYTSLTWKCCLFRHFK